MGLDLLYHGELHVHRRSLPFAHARFAEISALNGGAVLLWKQTCSMDIKRPPKSKLKKRLRTGALLTLGLAAIAGITFGLTKLKPAAPTVERSTAVIDTVKRGQMLRQVRGLGTLVPELTRRIPAPADGRVENIPLQAGVEVGPHTVVVELSNPQMEQQAMDADFQLKAAEAEQESLRVRLESEQMAQQAAIATINAEYS